MFGGIMKLKARILSVCLILSFLVSACGTANGNLDTQNVSVEESGSDIVTSSSEDAHAQSQEVVAEPEVDEEELAWANAMMPKVEDSLNVRVEPNAESDLAGHLVKGDRAEVLEIGEEWTKIKSGNLEGYVKNEYCIYGVEALEYARGICNTIATTITEGLRIREEMSTESKIIKRLEEGETLIVDTDEEVEEGWVAVKYKDNTYYVSAEYVTISLNVGTGETVAEIAARLEAEAEAKRKEEEEKRKEEEKKEDDRKEDEKDDDDGGSIAAEASDMDLMAAIIYCEAGGEPYETQLAVGAVIINRIQSSRFPNSLYAVIYQRGQFTPAMNGKLERVLRQGKATSSCYRAAEEAFSGVDNTNGCLFFNDYNGTKEGIRYGGMVFWW